LAASTRGTSVAAIGKALFEQGQTSLENWPYDPSIPKAGTRPAEVGEPPWLRAELGNQKVSVDQLWQKLLAGGPAVLVVAVVDALYKADKTTGMVSTPTPQASVFGYHAVVCVGLAEDDAQRKFFLIRNSWGTAWGVDGYGWLPEDFVATFATSMSWVHGVVKEAPDEAEQLSVHS
jgi:hypothetical protein